MALDETFRAVPKFCEKEVFALTGRVEEVRELRPSNFSGPIAEWAERREANYGETIVPRQVYVEPTDQGDHRVAWIYHEGIDLELNSTFSMHHIACDCNLMADQMTDQSEREHFLGDCGSLAKALRQRALVVNAAYGINNVINHYYDYERVAAEQDVTTQMFVGGSLLYMLEHDYRHPDSWMANVESGWSLITLTAGVLQLRYEDTAWFVDRLADQGAVETDGVVVQLPEQTRKEIDVEKLLRGLAA